jgi:hypothetical protein
MSNGRQVPDNSYSRSAGGAVLRGALLLLVALVVGVVLLQKSDSTPSASPTGDTSAVSDTTVGGSSDTTVGGGTPIASTTTVVQRAPNLVKVLIVNGSGKNRAAARVKAFLSTSGYDFIDPRDAKATNYADRVSYTPGFETEAKLIGSLLGLAAESIGPLPAEQTVKTPPEVPAFDVQIMVGQELATKYANQSLTGTTTSVAAATTLPA